jgi:hypothetical protein
MFGWPRKTWWQRRRLVNRSSFSDFDNHFAHFWTNLSGLLFVVYICSWPLSTLPDYFWRHCVANVQKYRSSGTLGDLHSFVLLVLYLEEERAINWLPIWTKWLPFHWFSVCRCWICARDRMAAVLQWFVSNAAVYYHGMMMTAEQWTREKCIYKFEIKMFQCTCESAICYVDM